jgi:hypothetical protein
VDSTVIFSAPTLLCTAELESAQNTKLESISHDASQNTADRIFESEGASPIDASFYGTMDGPRVV